MPPQAGNSIGLLNGADNLVRVRYAVAHAWFPEARFTSAQKDENSLSLTRDGEGSSGNGLHTPSRRSAGTQRI